MSLHHQCLTRFCCCVKWLAPSFLLFLLCIDAGVGVWSERFGFAERVFWVRSTQATCASAAGAGPAVIKAEEFALDPHTPGTADSEVSVLPSRSHVGRRDPESPGLQTNQCLVYEVLVLPLPTQLWGSDSILNHLTGSESNILCWVDSDSVMWLIAVSVLRYNIFSSYWCLFFFKLNAVKHEIRVKTSAVNPDNLVHQLSWAGRFPRPDYWYAVLCI